MTMFKSTINSTNFSNSSAPQSPNLDPKQKRINSAPSERRIKPKKKTIYKSTNDYSEKEPEKQRKNQTK